MFLRNSHKVIRGNECSREYDPYYNSTRNLLVNLLL